MPQFALALAYYVYFEEEPGRGPRRRTSSPGRGICLCNAELRTALLYTIDWFDFYPKDRRVPMSHAKQASTKRKRSINAVPVLSAAGLSLSLASGASAAIARPAADMPTPKTGMSHEITLCEEEISDVSLATFYVLNVENVGTFRRRIKLAPGGFASGSACSFGCGGGGGGGGGESTYSGAAPSGSYVTPPRYSKPTRKRRSGQVNVGIAANIAKLPELLRDTTK